MKGVDQYLARYAVDDPAVAGLVDRCYEAAIVVPVHDEDPAFIDTLGLRGLDAEVLVIVVVNGSRARAPQQAQRNLAVLQALPGRGRILGRVEGATWVRHDAADLLLLDHASPGRELEARQGVGRARRIGLDLALRLWRVGSLRSDWLHTTDADATLPAEHLRMPGDAEARVASFWHDTGDDPVGRATALYEIWLRYYVVGLWRAESPWAHHSIGSCISVRAEAYAAVRGVPEREAGEDFHLLAKLAKVGRIAKGSAAAVRIRARPSGRVPFGTGPAVARLMEGEALRLLDPRVFEELRDVQRGLRRLAEDPERPLASLAAGDLRLQGALDRIGALGGLARVRGQSPGSYRQLCGWLDARRTLRLLHALRDDGRPMLPWRQALVAAEFDEGSTEDVDAVRRRLAAAEPRG